METQKIALQQVYPNQLGLTALSTRSNAFLLDAIFRPGSFDKPFRMPIWI